MRPGEMLFFDSMMLNLAADRGDSRLEALLEGGKVQCLIPFSVREEGSRPESPPQIKVAISRFIYTCDVELNPIEKSDIASFQRLHRGDAEPKNIDADLTHVWEAAKYQGRYFVTADRRLLNRTNEIAAYKSIQVITLDHAISLYEVMAQQWCLANTTEV